MRLSLIFLAALTLVATEMTAPATTTAELIHQYCFTEDATDFVGSSNATLHGGASIVGGQLVLDGVDDYASLPIGDTIAAANSVTIEGWATVTENRTWSRLFDFGSNTTEYIFLTTDAGGPNGMEFSISSTGISGQQSVISADQFPLNMETHYAVTIDAATDIASIYINGSLVATSSGVTLTPSSLGNTTSNYLGRSQFADPFLIGSINEFRIYDNALTAAEVNASFMAGTQQCVPEPGMAPLILCLGVGGWYRRRRQRETDEANSTTAS